MYGRALQRHLSLVPVIFHRNSVEVISALSGAASDTVYCTLAHFQWRQGSMHFIDEDIIWLCYSPDTYDHRVWRTGLPVRSAVLKPHAGQLVVWWVTTCESWLLYVFVFVQCFRQVSLLPLYF